MPESSASAPHYPAYALPSHQTVQLGRGRHKGPDGGVVCVMELASMLAGERFSDRPKAVCAAISAMLREYNDEVDPRRRNDLFRFASDTVGTRIDYTLQERRCSTAIGWARPRYEMRRWLPRTLRPSPEVPVSDDGPDKVAGYVVGSLFREGAGWLRIRGGWSDRTHASLLRLLDRLIAMGPKRSMDALLAELAAEVQETVEPPCAAANPSPLEELQKAIERPRARVAPPPLRFTGERVPRIEHRPHGARPRGIKPPVAKPPPLRFTGERHPRGGAAASPRELVAV